MSDHSQANRRWEGQVNEFQQSDSYTELFGVDGEPIEFEWHIFPGFLSYDILQRIQKVLQDQNIEPENFEDRVIFVSIFNDIERTKKGNDVICISNSEKVKTYARKFPQGHWRFLGPGEELTVLLLKENGIPLPHEW